MLAQLLRNESNKWMDSSVATVEEFIGKERLQRSIRELVAKMIETNEVFDKKIADVFAPYRAQVIDEWIPKAVAKGMQWVSDQVEIFIDRLQIADIVRTEVETFSVERLEEMILSISRREFKMITYLGALLGGVIGVFQAIVGLSM